MSDVQQLKRAYREINAPPGLALRVRAEFADTPVRPPRLVPVAATLAIGVLALLPLIFMEPASRATAPVMPSLAMVSEMIPDGASLTSPSLSRVRSVKRPAMPSKPNVERVPVFDDQSLMNHNPSKENYHA